MGLDATVRKHRCTQNTEPRTTLGNKYRRSCKYISTSNSRKPSNGSNHRQSVIFRSHPLDLRLSGAFDLLVCAAPAIAPSHTSSHLSLSSNTASILNRSLAVENVSELVTSSKMSHLPDLIGFATPPLKTAAADTSSPNPQKTS